MPKASELKKGQVVDIDGAPHIVRQVEARSPSSRGAVTLYKVRFNNLINGQKRDESLKGDDMFHESDCIRSTVQFSYVDGEDYVFMDTEDYTQFSLPASDLVDERNFLTEGLGGIVALHTDGQLLSVTLPTIVDLVITETAPSIKGATAAGRTKTAVLSTGYEVQVPEYLAEGESIRVNTETGRFSSRS
ncbi:MAG: elongation factor P-like protein YeiP [Proteobacteria bacterium]|nr:elongation factor P-like protein YeiP [Pseudomonadota bacterium]